jgi:hypothetical protein
MLSLLLALTLMSEPTLTHDALHNRCTPGITLPGAPVACYREALQHSTNQLHGTLQRLRKSLIDTLQRRAPKLD